VNARTRKFFSKFLAYYRPYRRLLLADLACAFVVAAITLALPLIARHITKNLLEAGVPNALPQIYVWGALMVALIAIHTVCNGFVDYQGHAMGARMERDMRDELFAHYQKQHFGFYDEQKTGQLMSRLTNDIFWMTELFHHAPEDLVISLLKFVGAFVILLMVDVELTLLVFLFLPIMALYALRFNGKMQRALAESKERIGDINAQAEETLAGIRVVQAFTNEGVEQAKFARANEGFVASRSDGYRSEAYYYSGIVAFTQLITVAVIILGSRAITTSTLDLADLVTYLLYVGILIDPILRTVNFTRLYQEGFTGFVRFMDALEVVPAIQDAPDAVEIEHVRGEIQFRNVSFGYRDDHAAVFQNLSLCIRAGEYVALVGASGVGKSTLCALIPRFYEVNRGKILLDGRNIQEITLRSLRRNIGIVQQDTYLFAGTVADNIRYGKIDGFSHVPRAETIETEESHIVAASVSLARAAAEEEIVAAARAANAHDFIMRLPQGYATNIGQRGVKLSGGQKQRLSIARVFLKDPPIIIFDEATSALDNESERAIQASLERLTHNRTVLVIAHRLSTVRNAHRIIVLTDEGIAEEGTHAELIAANGAYANLYNVHASI
jgi:ATP-binding cassette subfamily B protein